MQAKGSKYNMLLASSVVVVAAVIICVVFYQSYDEKNEYYTALNNKLEKESQRFTKLDDISQVVAEYEEKFNSYSPVKRFENENRLYWLDVLNKIRSKHKIPKLSYNISTRKRYDYKDGIIKDRGLPVFVSNIKLTMSLMHEADLVAVINSLKKIKDSIHLVSSCQLKRVATNKNNSINATGPNIGAVCNVKWFTFKVS